MVIPNGRDPKLFEHRDPSPRSGAPRLVFLGHLAASKRPERFIEVVRLLREDGLEVDASVAGDGPRCEDIRAAAEAANVALLGRVNDVPALLARAAMSWCSRVSPKARECRVCSSRPASAGSRS